MSSGVHLWNEPENPDYPQSRAAVEAMSVEQMYDFAGNCDYEPAEPDVCLACYAYMLAQERDVAEKSAMTDPLTAALWPAEVRAAFRERVYHSGTTSISQSLARQVADQLDGYAEAARQRDEYRKALKRLTVDRMPGLTREERAAEFARRKDEARALLRREEGK